MLNAQFFILHYSLLLISFAVLILHSKKFFILNS